MWKFSVALLIALPLFGGQSVLLSNSTASTTSFRTRSHSLPSRVEFYLHDWSTSGTTLFIADSDAIGFKALLYNPGPGNLQLAVYNAWEADPVGICQVQLGTANGSPGLSAAGVYVRYQHDPAGALGAPKSDYCEMWDVNGNRIAAMTTTWTRENDASGNSVIVGGGVDSRAVAFFRIHSSLIPPNSRMPVTADNADTLLHWRFDGNLSDASGNNYTGRMANAKVDYVPTPHQDVISVVKTANAPVWSNWVTVRAGQPSQLDGSASFSQGDNGAGVTCNWQISGPITPVVSDASSCAPTLTGLVFGDYAVTLQVTDPNGQIATSTQHIGAVAMDDNGVVINADPNADIVFGPMIAFGKNPWGYADERALAATTLRKAAYEMPGSIAHPTWTTNGQGTISYSFGGVGNLGPPGTRLCGSIASATSLSILVCDASKLDLSALPTRILINPGTKSEEVRICSATGASSRQTLGVCYDGRGQIGGSPYVVAAQAWNTGTGVGQYKITGTNTRFVSDPNTPICPAGAPGPPSRVTYSAGTVSVAAGSADISGNGTTWTTSSNVIATYIIRIDATHAGAPFVFTAPISGVKDPGHLLLGRIYPADADSGTFSYQIVAYRYASLHYTRSDGSDGNLLQYMNGCESETAMYGTASHDIPVFDKITYTGVHYSYKDGLGAQSAYGPNFYGEGFAHRALYLRSGLAAALTAANEMDETWIKDPEIDGCYPGGIPLLQGGGVIGAFADLILNKDTRLTWSDVRQCARNAAIGTWTCNSGDTRDTGYLGAWVTLAALFDPDPAQRDIWKASLRAINARDNACKGSDNSWANGFIFNTASPKLNVTNGSAVVTAPSNDLPPSVCFGVASGSVSVTHGSAAFSGSGLINGNKIVIASTTPGSARQSSGAEQVEPRTGRIGTVRQFHTPYVGMFQFTQSGGTSGTLAALWPGDSGTFPYVIENNDFYTAIATGNDDPMLKENFACTWNNSGQITLDRPWDGPTDHTGANHIYSYVLAGYGQQPYMLGIKTTAMKWASSIDDTEASNYRDLAAAAATWVHDFGFDPATQGLHYGRIYQPCEPYATPTPSTAFGFTAVNCGMGLDPGSIRASRGLTAEASSALRAYYESNPTQDRKDWGDLAYGSIWGYAPFTTGGVYSDPYYVKDENSNASLAAFKWTGFFFGMGLAHQWPAVRLGGVQHAQNQKVFIPFNLAGVPKADHVEMTVMQPSGVRMTVSCSSSPCPVTVDKRQGKHLVQINYLSASGSLVAREGIAQ